MNDEPFARLETEAAEILGALETPVSGIRTATRRGGEARNEAADARALLRKLVKRAEETADEQHRALEMLREKWWFNIEENAKASGAGMAREFGKQIAAGLEERLKALSADVEGATRRLGWATALKWGSRHRRWHLSRDSRWCVRLYATGPRAHERPGASGPRPARPLSGRGRGTPASSSTRWHFVDIEISAAGYEAARDCPGGDCVVYQIRKDERLLADARLTRSARAEALRFLIHFVGDIHQPLHCADHHDRGGNEVRVMLGGEETNLHAVWDTAVVAALGDDPAAVSARLEARIAPRQARVWSRGGPAEWANESFAIAKHVIYGPLLGAQEKGDPIQLPDDYAVRERHVAAEQLEKAGVRLATVLNTAFSARPAAAVSANRLLP